MGAEVVADVVPGADETVGVVAGDLEFRQVTFVDHTNPGTGAARESQLVSAGSDNEPPF